jgi:hypothetical protein
MEVERFLRLAIRVVTAFLHRAVRVSLPPLELIDGWRQSNCWGTIS